MAKEQYDIAREEFIAAWEDLKRVKFRISTINKELPDILDDKRRAALRAEKERLQRKALALPGEIGELGRRKALAHLAYMLELEGEYAAEEQRLQGELEPLVARMQGLMAEWDGMVRQTPHITRLDVSAYHADLNAHEAAKLAHKQKMAENSAELRKLNLEIRALQIALGKAKGQWQAQQGRANDFYPGAVLMKSQNTWARAAHEYGVLCEKEAQEL